MCLYWKTLLRSLLFFFSFSQLMFLVCYTSLRFQAHFSPLFCFLLKLSFLCPLPLFCNAEVSKLWSKSIFVWPTRRTFCNMQKLWESQTLVFINKVWLGQPHLFVYIYRLWLLRCYSDRAEFVQPRSSYCKASNIYYLAFCRNSFQTPTLVVVWKLYTLFCSFSGHPSIFFSFPFLTFKLT